jgi:TRAP-type mannitol/chloroaromatic compound transport system substrate-binding protein
LSQGVTVSLFPQEVLDRLYQEAEAYYKEVTATNAEFAKIYDSQREFQRKNNMYHRVADFQYDLMMLRFKR